MSSPEDKKIEFENLSLSEDLSGSLEPISEPAPELEAEAEAKAAEAHAEAEEKSEQPDLDAGLGAEAPAPSKIRDTWAKLKTSDPFTVMLGITVAALLIAILCCLIELGRYGFHISTKEARTSVSMTAPMDIHRSTC